MQLIKKQKPLAENDFVFFSTFIIIGFLLFITGLESFISSSEFWSIFISKNLFTGNVKWDAVYLKPVFHLLLSLIYAFDLNDFYHIIAAKVLFAINGVLQFVLVFKILELIYKMRLLNLFLACFIISAPYFISHMFQVRSDQLALTAFLFLVSLSLKKDDDTRRLQLVIACIFPLIAFKHIYFLVLALPVVPLKPYFENWKKKTFLSKVIPGLLVVNFIVWVLDKGNPALHYFLNSYDSTLFSWRLLLTWAKTEWFYIYFSFLPFLFKDFRNYLKIKKLEYLLVIQLSIVFILFFHSQKLPFFIASFLPVLYLTIAIFCQYLNEKKLIAYKIVLPILVLGGSHSIYQATKYYHVFSLNNPQLIAIDRISNIITKNNMTYLDGMGILPRGKNVGCFVSPEDEIATRTCNQYLNQHLPDAIIVTNRLMGFPFDFTKLEEMGYVTVGPNLYIRHVLSARFKGSGFTWPAPSRIFSFEQLY